MRLIPSKGKVMILIINGKEQEVACAMPSVAEVMKACGFPNRGVAVAVDNRVVRRSSWEDTRLIEGQSLTVIKAVCGG